MIAPRCGRDRPRPSGVANSASAASAKAEQGGGAENQRHLQDAEVNGGGGARREEQHRREEIQHQPVDFAAQADDGNAGLPARPDAARGDQQGQGQQRFQQQLLREVGQT